MYLVRFIIFIAILICSSAQAGATATEGKRSVVFLFDVSNSISAEDRNKYFQAFRQVLESLSAGDDFVALKIGRDSQLLDPIISGVMPEKEKGVTAGYYEKQRKKIIGISSKKVGMFLKNTVEDRTSIMSSLVAANDYFDSKPKHHKYIFMFSDMIEASPFLNMERASEYRVKKYITLGDNNISDALVYVVGVNAGERNYAKLKEFWTAFLAQYGCALAYYQNNLVNFSFK